MKRGTPEHPKMFDLAEAIHAYLAGAGIDLPFEIVHTLACGMFERLCHYTARYAPAGDVGKHSDLRIALAIGWRYDAQFIVDTLVKCRILDAIENARLYVHDWHDHSDDAADKWLYRNNLCYANGSQPRSGKKEREKKSRHSRDKSRHVPTPSRNVRLSESQSESYTESSSSSQPKSEPEPKQAAVAATLSLPSRLDTNEFREAWSAWCRHRKEIKKPLKDTQAAAQLETFAQWGEERSVAAIRYTIRQGWQGIREEEPVRGPPNRAQDPRGSIAAANEYLADRRGANG